MNVYIRNIEADDARFTWMYRSNENTWKYMECDSPLPATYDSEMEYYQKMSKDKDTKMFAIVVDGCVVGCCKLKNIANGAAEVSYYMLNDLFRNRGICTYAVGLMIDHAFYSYGLDLLYRYVDKRNIPSYKMTLTHKFAPVGISYINSNVERFEMTRTGWTNRKKRK